MNNVLKAVASANEAGLAAVTNVQEQLLDLHRQFASAVTGLDVPSWLPTPDSSETASAVEQAAEFGVKLANANKDFALGVIQAWTPPKAAAKK
jgi:hypothetical protein